MDDRRRRRRTSEHSESGGSEDGEKTLSSNGGKNHKVSECESEGHHLDEGSEYESATETYDDETDTYDEETEETATEAGTEFTEDDVVVEGEYDDGWMDGERQSGDGEEQPDSGKEKNLDDDEDRKNPAYIPRKGAFYEHDNRLGEELQEATTEKEPVNKEAEQKATKKLWVEDTKWIHDKYIEDYQKPKSREEIIALYGYDIRAHSEPPEAPPRRGGGGRGRGRRGNRQERRNKLQDYIRVPQDANTNNSQDYYQGNKSQSNYQSSGYRGKEPSYQSSSSPRDNLSQDDHLVQYRDGYQDGGQYSRGRGGPRGGRGSSSRGRGGRGGGSGGGYQRDYRDDNGPGPRYGNRGRGRGDGHRTTYSSLRHSSTQQDYKEQPQTAPPQQQQQQQQHQRQSSHENSDAGGYQNNERRGYNQERQGNGRGPLPPDARRQAPLATVPAAKVIDSESYYDDDTIPPMTTPYTGTTTTRTQAINSYHDRKTEPRKKKVGTTRLQEYEEVGEREEKRVSGRELQHGGYSQEDLLNIFPPTTTIPTSSRSSAPRQSGDKGNVSAAQTPPALDAPGSQGQGQGTGQGRQTKRYSSQRQRNPPESGFQESAPSPPVSMATPGGPPQQGNRPGLYYNQRYPPPRGGGQQVGAPRGHSPRGSSPRGPSPRGGAPQMGSGPLRGGNMGGPPRGVPTGTPRGSAPPHPGSAPPRGARQAGPQANPRAAMTQGPRSARPPPGAAGRTPGVPMFPRAGTTHQSPPHTVTSFPQPPIIPGSMQAPMASMAYTIPVSSHVQSQSGGPFNPPPTSVTLATQVSMATPMATIAAPHAPIATAQPLMQSQFIPTAPVVNYGPPGAPPAGPGPHYQLPGSVALPLTAPLVNPAPSQEAVGSIPFQPTQQQPPPTQGSEGIQVRGGTTYFSPEAQTPMQAGSGQEGIHVRGGTTYFNPESQPYQGLSPSRHIAITSKRPKAAIPIVNPQESAGAQYAMMPEQYDQEGGEPQDYHVEYYPDGEVYEVDPELGHPQHVDPAHREEVAGDEEYQAEYEPTEEETVENLDDVERTPEPESDGEKTPEYVAEEEENFEMAQEDIVGAESELAGAEQEVAAEPTECGQPASSEGELAQKVEDLKLEGGDRLCVTEGTEEVSVARTESSVQNNEALNQEPEVGAELSHPESRDTEMHSVSAEGGALESDSQPSEQACEMKDSLEASQSDAH